MQITGMLNQYNRNIANGTEISGGTQGIRQVASSLQEMAPGNVFEGSVNHMENGTVTLGMSDGKTIQAKLDAGVSVRVGESMFFQVRSNNGTQIAIRPFSGGNGSNPTLLNALKAANLPVNGKMLTMVHTMMEQAMSIDRQSLSQMARLVMGHEGMDVANVVQMMKLGIPITEEMMAQFENYKYDQYAILDQLESVMEQLPKQLADGGMGDGKLFEFNQQILEVFLGEGKTGEDGQVLPALLDQAAHAPGEAAQEQPDLVRAAVQSEASGAVDELLQDAVSNMQEAVVAEDGAKRQTSEPSAKAALEQPVTAEEADGHAIKAGQDTLKHLLSSGEVQNLSRMLAEIPGLSRHPALFSEGSFQADIPSKELMRLLQQAFASQDTDVRKALGELASSKEYRTLVRNMMERQWLLKPEELKTDHKVNELYERMDRQLAQMEKVLRSFGQSAPQLADTASSVRSNIQFMNQINQIFTYVQIPLKLAGQNAHSDLYVYTDKRRMQEKDRELTAFLSLDLDYLGSTDISIRLYQNHVSTNFYLASENSYRVILDNMQTLEQRLTDRGYQVQIQVLNQKAKGNFMEELLQKGTASSGGMVHRYSFDVRA